MKNSNPFVKTLSLVAPIEAVNNEELAELKADLVEDLAVQAVNSQHYHEAAHAVVGSIFGLPVRYVSSRETSFYHENDVTNRSGKIIMNLAGKFSEYKYDTRFGRQSLEGANWNGFLDTCMALPEALSSDDGFILTELFGEIFKNTVFRDYHYYFLKRCEKATNYLLNDPIVWQAITLVAKGIYKNGKVEESEFNKLLIQSGLLNSDCSNTKKSERLKKSATVAS